MTTYKVSQQKNANSLRGVTEPKPWRAVDGEFNRKKHSFLILSPLNFLSYNGGGFVYNEIQSKGNNRHYFANNELAEDGSLLAKAFGWKENLDGALTQVATNKGVNKVLINEQYTGIGKTQQILGTPWDGTPKELKGEDANNLKLSEVIFSDKYNNEGGLSRVLHPNLVRYNNGVSFSSLILNSIQGAVNVGDRANTIFNINKASFELFSSVANDFLSTMKQIPKGEQDPQYIYVNELLHRATEAFNSYNSTGDLFSEIIFTYGIYLSIEGYKGVNASNTTSYSMTNKSYILSKEDLLRYVSTNPALVRNKDKSQGSPYYVKTNLTNLSLLRYLLPSGGFTQIKFSENGQDLYLPSTSFYSFEQIVSYVFAKDLVVVPTLNPQQVYSSQPIYAPQVNYAPQQAYSPNPMSQVYTQQAQYAPQQTHPIQQPQAQQAYVPHYVVPNSQQFPTQPPAYVPPVNNAQNSGFVTPDSLTDIVGTAPVQNQYPTQETQPLRGFETDTFTPQGSGDVPF
jgi:hypothetical protein